MDRERKAKMQVERQVEERQKKLDEQKRKEEQKRLAVEEKRKQKQEEEKVAAVSQQGLFLPTSFDSAKIIQMSSKHRFMFLCIYF